IVTVIAHLVCRSSPSFQGRAWAPEIPDCQGRGKTTGRRVPVRGTAAGRRCKRSSWGSGEVGQGAVAAEVGVAEADDAVAEAVGERQQEAVVVDLVVPERAAHAEVEPAADEDEGDVVQRVRVPLAQLVGPDDQRVVEQRAGA